MAKRRVAAQAPDKQRINERIRVSPLRVIGSDGEQLGVIPTEEAMERAQSEGLDLVEVAPTETPPVCRIMDYGKYKYQQKKRLHKNQAHQTKIKEIRVRPKTGASDIQVKVDRARKFLEHKDKVIVTVIFRGREMAHIDEGRKVIDEVIAQLSNDYQAVNDAYLMGGLVSESSKLGTELSALSTQILEL